MSAGFRVNQDLIVQCYGCRNIVLKWGIYVRGICPVLSSFTFINVNIQKYEKHGGTSQN